MVSTVTSQHNVLETAFSLLAVKCPDFVPPSKDMSVQVNIVDIAADQGMAKNWSWSQGVGCPQFLIWSKAQDQFPHRYQ